MICDLFCVMIGYRAMYDVVCRSKNVDILIRSGLYGSLGKLNFFILHTGTLWTHELNPSQVLDAEY